METLELRKDLYWCGVLDPDLEYFDIIMRTKYGTTYNSYFLRGSEKSAIIDSVKVQFFEEFIEHVKEFNNNKKIDYVIVSHTEPDHSGSIEKILEINPDVVIVGSAVAINFLKNIVEKPFKSMAVKEGDVLDLGDKKLEFISARNLHWPDVTFTYWREEGIIFTCDAFGDHYCFDQILRSKLPQEKEAEYYEALKYYYDCIMQPFSYPFVHDVMNKVKDLDIKMICTGHGPVLDSNIKEVFDRYIEWSQPYINEKKKIVIAYVSSYCYTKYLANYIKEGIQQHEDIVVEVYNVQYDDKAKIIDAINKADGVLLGSPTMVGQALEPIYELTLNLLAPKMKGKLASAFGSYGWSGEAVGHLIERLNQLTFKTVEGYKCKFKPFKEDIDAAKNFGFEFAKSVLDK